MTNKYKSQPCPDCDRCFSSDSNLNNHINGNICKKKEKNKTCELCGYIFSDKKGYKYHKNKNVHSQFILKSDGYQILNFRWLPNK
jgi:uncharacterized C2H2 Zn-finger protein